MRMRMVRILLTRRMVRDENSKNVDEDDGEDCKDVDGK